MYCMRYFVPLLLLPFPDSPPIFVLLFLISFFLHQKPCIYCTLLLFALFSSTCFWGQGRCWVGLNGMKLFDVHGMAADKWNPQWKIPLPIGTFGSS
ncbi:hypothetical protein BC943DRAFT_329532 [Umbelopsis sp. AD052]|nr:hypothetical protein BC943DRAFT_329532 [Umbelopsis sp. AD052]